MLHLNYNTFRLQKVFVELRFKESFKIPQSETRYALLDKFTEKYPAFNTNDPEQIAFSNPEKRQSMTITINRIILDWDEPKSLDDFIKSINRDINTTCKQLDIENFDRVGMRTIHAFDVENINSVSQFIFKEYVNSNFQNEKLGDQFFNPRVTFSGKKNNLNFNFGIGYQQFQRIHGSLGSELKQEIKDLLAIDLDIYKEKMKITKLNDYLNEAKIINRSLPDYIKAIGVDN